MFYYNLTEIAINLVKSFTLEHELGRGSDSIPTNKTEVKLKIIGQLLALRKMNEECVYELEQAKYIGTYHDIGERHALQISFTSMIALGYLDSQYLWRKTVDTSKKWLRVVRAIIILMILPTSSTKYANKLP